MFNTKKYIKFYFIATVCFAFFALLIIPGTTRAIGSCSFEVISPTRHQVISKNQSIPVKIRLINCPKAYKVDYALTSLTIPSLKQVYEPNVLLGDFNYITLPSYSSSKVNQEFVNCGTTHLVVSV